MKTLHSLLTCTAACIVHDAGGTSPGRIQLMPMGDFAARDGRPGSLKGKASVWRLTPEIAAAVVEKWAGRKTPLVVDYEHQTMNAETNGKPAPAAGWIEELTATPEGLFATVRWTERARAYIQADEYRYISPVFTYDPDTGAVLELKSAALTNYPALDGMEAVAARRKEDTMNNELAALLRTRLGLPEDADETAILTELKKLPGDTSLFAFLTAKDEEIAALKTATPDPKDFVPAAMLTAAQEKVTALAAKVAELEKGNEAATLSAEIDAALADGRLPKSCETWARAMVMKNPEAIRGYIESAAPLSALKETQTGGKAPSGVSTAALTEEERYACKAAGISETDFIAAKTKEKN